MQACTKQDTIAQLRQQVVELHRSNQELHSSVTANKEELTVCRAELKASEMSKQQILADAEVLHEKVRTSQRQLAAALARLDQDPNPSLASSEETRLVTVL